MSGSKRITGDLHERSAADFLQKQGLKLLDTNLSSRHGEIDLIMQDKNTLVFVEVRYRRNKNFGGAAISVTAAKQRKIALTALTYLQRSGKTEMPCRFDVIAINGQEILDSQWIKNAFESPL